MRAEPVLSPSLTPDTHYLQHHIKVPTISVWLCNQGISQVDVEGITAGIFTAPR